MKSIVVALALSSLMVAVSSAGESDFQLWMAHHQKSYPTDEEYARREANYMENMKFIQDYGSSSFKMSLNQFADLSQEEYARTYLSSHKTGASPSRSRNNIDNVDLPKSVDWRTVINVPAVQNQGECGTSSVIVATTTVETMFSIVKNLTVELSQQQIIDCLMGGTCDGSFGVDQIYKYMLKAGIDPVSCYPTKGTGCRFKSDCALTFKGYSNVKAGDENALATAVATEPVAVTIDASHSSFQLYSGGVYYEANCSTTALDHEMTIVGYGSDNNDDFWIAQNSWGTSWGEKGYIRLARNKNNNCGVASLAYYPTD